MAAGSGNTEREDAMTIRAYIAIASTTAAVTATAIIVPAGAGCDTGAINTTVDRPDNKQYRDLYVSPASALEAAKKGEPLPSGTVLTLVQYAAVLDPQGNPQKDANGRFMKGNLIAYTVMEKR